MKRFMLASVVGLLLLYCTSSAEAVQLRMEISDAIGMADVIVHGKVSRTEARWVEDERGRHIRTYATIGVLSHLKGGSGRELDAEFDGGTVGGMTETVSDTASVAEGEEAVFFLKKDRKTGMHRPAAGGYSKYRIIKGKAYGLSGRTTVEEIRASATNPEGAAATVEPQAETLDSTNIYNNSTTGSYYTPGTNVEVTDFGTTTGGHIVKFTFGYVTTLPTPGSVTIKFYSGTTSSTKGTLLKSFTYSGLRGSTTGSAGGYTQTIVLPPADHFDLPSGAFGYSMTFDNANTGVWLATGGTGNIDGFWIGSSYSADPFGAGSDGSFYMKLEKNTGTGPDITGITPGSASAGTDTEVTITGTGFGVSQGAGTVNFFYKDGSSTIPGVVTSWSDTSITCKVPVGVVDGYSGSAASGPVTVTTSGAATSDGYPFTVTFGYGQSKWNSSPVDYEINENTADCSGEGASFQAAADTWSGAGANFAFHYNGAHTNTVSGYNGHNEVLWGTVASAGIIAQATYWISGPQIVETDIVFNDVNFTWDTGGAPSGSQMDVQTIALHELGHWLNLRDLYGSSGYNGNDNTKVMYGFAGNGLVKRSLTQADSDGILWIYPPVIPTDYAVNLSVGGTGSGSVVSTPGGLACNANCSARFDRDSTVTLAATRSPYSLFGSWSGCTSVSGTDCQLYMDGDKTPTVTFNKDTAHQTYNGGGAGSYSPTIQAAYDAATPGDLIRMWATDFTESPACGADKAVVLSGGYDEGYTANSGTTNIHGAITIAGGTVSVENIAIMP